MTRSAFPGISSRTWEHPADRSALIALRKLPGFDIALKGMVGFFSERRLRMLYLASSVRVSEHQFAGLHALHLEAARILDLDDVPELYVVQNPVVNAWALGLDSPFVVVTTGMLDLFDNDEMRAVLGHELGHIRSGHALYTSMLYILMMMSGVASWVPFGPLGMQAVIHALKEWYRKAELSSDRAGLLVSQDLDVSIRVHMKVAGGARVAEMDVMAFLDQARDYESSGDVREGVIRMLNVLPQTHPFAAVRALELTKWVESGAYERIVAGDYPRREGEPYVSVTDEVKAGAASYKETFDRTTDPFLRLVRDVGSGAVDVGGWFAEQVRKMAGGSPPKGSASYPGPTARDQSTAPGEGSGEPSGDGSGDDKS